MALRQWLARVSRRQFHSEGTLEKYVCRAHADVRHMSWTSPYCPPLPPIFADAAWCDMAAFLQKLGGEGRGEGAVLARCLQRKPLIRPIGHLLPQRGRRDCVHAAKIDQKPTSVNPTLQACRCPVRPGKALASHSTDGVMAGDGHVMCSPCGTQCASLTEIVCQRPKGALCSLRRNRRRSPERHRGTRTLYPRASYACPIGLHRLRHGRRLASHVISGKHPAGKTTTASGECGS